MTDAGLAPEKVATAVKRMLIDESRVKLDPADLPDDEPLSEGRLNVSSLGFVGMLVRLEDELDLDLPDDLFVDRTFDTVGDVVATVLQVADSQQTNAR
jgi:acyl carrier protein